MLNTLQCSNWYEDVSYTLAIDTVFCCAACHQFTHTNGKINLVYRHVNGKSSLVCCNVAAICTKKVRA